MMNKKGIVFSLGAFLILFVCVVFAFSLQRFDTVFWQQQSDEQVYEALIYARDNIAHDVAQMGGFEVRNFANATQIGINLTGNIQIDQGLDYVERISNYTTYYQSYMQNNVELDWSDQDYTLHFVGNNASMTIHDHNITAQLNTLGTLEHLVVRAEVSGGISFSWGDDGPGNPYVEFYITNETGTYSQTGNLDGNSFDFATSGSVSIGYASVDGNPNTFYAGGGDVNITELYIAFAPHENNSYVTFDNDVNISLGDQSIYGGLHLLDMNR